MASCLQVENLTKSYGEQVLFENISFTIEEGRRVALVAKNGTGKTTLLNIIAGKESHDAGSVVPRRGLRIAYLEQSPAYPAGMTVLEACFHSESPALKAIAEYERAIGDASGEGLQEAMARMPSKRGITSSAPSGSFRGSRSATSGKKWKPSRAGSSSAWRWPTC